MHQNAKIDINTDAQKNIQNEQEKTAKLIKKHTYLYPRTLLGKIIMFIITFSFLMIYPGLYFSNKVYPLIFGLPYSFVWITFWIHMIVFSGIAAAFTIWKN